MTFDDFPGLKRLSVIAEGMNDLICDLEMSVESLDSVTDRVLEEAQKMVTRWNLGFEVTIDWRVVDWG